MIDSPWRCQECSARISKTEHFFGGGLCEECMAVSAIDPALASAWDALQATPSYVERDLHEVKPLLLMAAYGPAHTLSAPFCADERCGCHKDDRLFDEYILEPMMAGLLTSYEANRLMWPE